MARPRKPTALKVLKGTLQPCRTNKNEPHYDPSLPQPPAHLSEKAQTVWGFVAALLGPRGVVTKADPLALECLCETYADLVEARNAIREAGGPTYQTENENGSVIYRSRPEVAIVADCDRRLRSWYAAFGLTPADRSKVSAIEKPEESPWMQLKATGST